MAVDASHIPPYPKPIKPVSHAGIQFSPDAKGSRSSTKVAKRVMTSALSVLDKQAASKVMAEKDWRWKYYRHFTEVAKLSAASSADLLRSCEAGLHELHMSMQYVLPNGRALSLTELIQEAPRMKTTFHTGEVVGNRSLEGFPSLPIPYKDQMLEGEALRRQVDKWLQDGIMEPSAGQNIKDVCCGSLQPVLDLAGKHFIVLGAGSQMGPTACLLSLGATVHAIDLPRPDIWKRLIALARNSRGVLSFPVSSKPTSNMTDDQLASIAGADLLKNTLDLMSWCLQVAPGKPLSVGNYTYLDGSQFVRIVAAADAIQCALCEHRPGTSLAILCSPTETYAIPDQTKAAIEASWNKFTPHALWHWPLNAISRGRYLSKNEVVRVETNTGDHVNLIDSYVWQQGPNYAFAKQIQRWRAMLARSRGHIVSANVGPASVTESVLHNRLVAAGMYGCAHFGIEAFEPRTANALMTALLLYDLNSPSAYANPATKLASPLLLFAENSVHGGSWNCGYLTNSYTEVSALVYFVNAVQPYIGVAGAALYLKSKL